jgi:hypothetical protein
MIPKDHGGRGIPPLTNTAKLNRAADLRVRRKDRIAGASCGWHSRASAPHGWAITSGPHSEINSFSTDGESSGDNVSPERCRLFSAVRPRFAMTAQVVRCPYCVLGGQFRPLVPHLDGTFICENCGHVSLPDRRSFKCSCYRCQELHSSRIHRDVSSVLKIKSVASP